MCVCAVVLCLVVGMVRVCGYAALCMAVVVVCAAVLLPCLAAAGWLWDVGGSVGQ